MKIFDFRTPLQKEWDKLEKQETAFLNRKSEKQQSKLNALLADKVPAGLQSTLDNAFNKAFHTVFTKGTGIIEKPTIKTRRRKPLLSTTPLQAVQNQSARRLNVWQKPRARRQMQTLRFPPLQVLALVRWA